jgi:hypothetical protein
VKTSTEKNFVIPAGLPSNNFGLQFKGFFEAGAEGLYEFYAASDDGSKLTVDGEDIIVHDGLHGVTERQGSLYLSKGFHEISLDFFQAGGGSGLKVQMKGPDGVRRDVPEEMVWHLK